MELKKTKKANLENKRGLFFQVGLIITMGLTLMAFEWYSPYEAPEITEHTGAVFEELDATTITRPEKQKIQEPKRVVHTIIPVDDNTDLSEFDINDLDWTDFEFKGDLYQMETEERDPFIPIEIMPTYKGGDQTAFWKDVYSRLKYPALAQEMGIQGAVHVSFIVDENGDMTEIKIIRSDDPVFNEVVLRVLSESDRWVPGRQRDKNVKVGFRMAFNFRLN